MDAKHDPLTVTPMLRNSEGQDTGLEFRLHSVHREAVLACYCPMAVDSDKYRQLKRGPVQLHKTFSDHTKYESFSQSYLLDHAGILLVVVAIIVIFIAI